MFEKEQFPQALFFGHLVLEKILKAHWVKDNEEVVPPKIHNLVVSAKQTNILFEADALAFLESINLYQLEGRYQNYLFTLYKISNKERSSELLLKVKELYEWLNSQF